MRSIPPKGSIPPHIRRAQKVRSDSDSTIRRTTSGQMGSVEDQSGQNDFQPTVVVKKGSSARRPVSTPIITLPVWPDRADPEVIEYENRVWVIVEFPRHTLEQIKWRNEGNWLTIESALPACSYTNKIALPQNRGKRVDIKLNNGLLVVMFEK